MKDLETYLSHQLINLAIVLVSDSLGMLRSSFNDILNVFVVRY